MSQSIWTRCGGRANLRRLAGRAWRVVEAQHVLSTRKLVDSVEDQRILEDLLETVKPPLPDGCERLHWLLATPFRYRPLRHGSRFARRDEPSLWYGSARLSTALAETAYYRLVFLEGTDADLGAVTHDLSAFRAAWRSPRAVDLCRPPFDLHREDLSSPTDCSASRELGAAMRADGVEAFRYPSARDPARGTNVGLFTPRAFARDVPEAAETWHAVTTRGRVEFLRRDGVRDRTVVFERGIFEVDGCLPMPGA